MATNMPIPESHKQYLVRQENKPCEELYDIDNDPDSAVRLWAVSGLHSLDFDAEIIAQ